MKESPVVLFTVEFYFYATGPYGRIVPRDEFLRSTSVCIDFQNTQGNVSYIDVRVLNAFQDTPSVCRQTEAKKRLFEARDVERHTTHKVQERDAGEPESRGVVTLEIPRSWATIMAGYYDKLKRRKKTGYNRDSVVQTDWLLSSGVETNYSRGRLC